MLRAMTKGTPALLAGMLALSAGLGGNAAAQDVNVEEVLRCLDHPEVGPEQCNEARDLILNNCTTCHTFVPIVLQQSDEGAWRGLLDRHRSRATKLSEEDFNLIHQYLSANFNPENEPPELPPALLETWTDY